MIYRNPRQPFSLHSHKTFEIDGTPVEIRWGEISSPAVATVAGWVFEIHEEGIELLIRPPKPRTAALASALLAQRPDPLPARKCLHWH